MKSSRILALFPAFFILAEAGTYLANDMYLPSLPAIARDFGCSCQMAEWTIASYIAGLALFTPLTGPIAEAYGPRKTLLVTLFIFLGSLLGCALAPTIGFFLACRVIGGGMMSFVATTGFSIVHTNYHKQEALRIISRILSITVLAPTIGPVIGGVIVTFGSWHLSFYIVFVIVSIGIMGLFKNTPADPTQLARKLDLATIKHHFKGIASNKPYMMGAIMYGFLMSAFIAWITVGPTVMMEHFGVSPSVFGALQIPIIGGFSLASWFVNTLQEHMTAENIIKLGMTTSTAGILFLLTTVMLGSASVTTVTAGMTIFSLGAGFTFPPLNRLTMLTSKAPMTYNSGFFYTVINGMTAVGSFLASLVAIGKPIPLIYVIGAFYAGGMIYYYRWLSAPKSYTEDPGAPEATPPQEAEQEPAHTV